MAKPSKTAGKVGRPPTDVEWRGISIRLKAHEKEELEELAPKVGLPQAEFIRQATLRLMRDVRSTGRLEIEIAD